MRKLILPIILFSVSLCLLFILLNFINPASAGPFGILLVFVAIYMSSFGLVALFLFGASRVVSHTVAIITKKEIKPFNLKKSYLYSSIISCAPVMFIALTSVGMFDIYGISLILLFVVLGCLYITKRNK